MIGGPDRFCPRFRQRLPLFPGNAGGDVFRSLAHEIRGHPQSLVSLERRHALPGVEASLRRRQGGIQFTRLGEGQLADLHAVCRVGDGTEARARGGLPSAIDQKRFGKRSEEHTSELQSLMRISYAVFCLKKKKTIITRKES